MPVCIHGACTVIFLNDGTTHLMDRYFQPPTMSLPTNESVGVQAPSTDDNLRRDETFYFTDVIISVSSAFENKTEEL